MATRFRFASLGASTRSAMSFLDVTKYPPSLDFLLATCGILLLCYAGIDALLERRQMKWPAQIARVYGSVPFFFYVLHLYLLHLLLIPIALVIANRLHVALRRPMIRRFRRGGAFRSRVGLIWSGSLWSLRFILHADGSAGSRVRTGPGG